MTPIVAATRTVGAFYNEIKNALHPHKLEPDELKRAALACAKIAMRAHIKEVEAMRGQELHLFFSTENTSPTREERIKELLSIQTELEKM